ncbi:predicted protein [Nematostella vectensis]|uniref:Large ribosomal subunit protein mL37 n=1 Tax=Nematostella vectensis TaxID=45351 RepID=A7SD45_NEMVE|nr:predicted protein [Nematostella vectensis]|eukprot:XP_001630423.1 predicted protein [Nematostella vectensis]
MAVNMLLQSRLFHGHFRRNLKPHIRDYAFFRCSRLSTMVKPYIFHSKTRTLESDSQGLYLTKSVLVGDMPTFGSENTFEAIDRDELMSRYRQCVLQTRLFNYEGERSTKTTCAMPLMQNMMKVVWSLADRFPGLLDMTLSYKPHVSATWPRGKQDVQVSGNLGFLLSSKNILSPFANPDQVNATKKQSLENLDIIAPVFNLHQMETKGEMDTGFYPGAPYPNLHTLVMVNTEKDWSIRDISAQGMMFTFARLVAEATCNHGYKMGEDLEEPLTGQCIMTNGIRLSFLCFQLNTLDLRSDEGVKNMVWLKSGVQMYERARLEEIPPERKLDPITYEAKVEGFNTDSFEMFTNMLLNGSQDDQS